MRDERTQLRDQKEDVREVREGRVEDGQVGRYGCWKVGKLEGANAT